MKKKRLKVAICCLFALILAGCRGETLAAVEVARIVPQTIEVTRIAELTSTTSIEQPYALAGAEKTDESGAAFPSITVVENR